MTNRNSLLGRSRPRGKLTREEIAALDEATVPPAPAAKLRDSCILMWWGEGTKGASRYPDLLRIRLFPRLPLGHPVVH